MFKPPVRLAEMLGAVLLILFKQAMTKVNQFVHIIRESIIVPKWELAYNLKSSSDAHK